MKKKLMLVGVMSILMFNVASANVNREVEDVRYENRNTVKVITYSDGMEVRENVKALKALVRSKSEERKDRR